MRDSTEASILIHALKVRWHNAHMGGGGEARSGQGRAKRGAVKAVRAEEGALRELSGPGGEKNQRRGKNSSGRSGARRKAQATAGARTAPQPQWQTWRDAGWARGGKAEGGSSTVHGRIRDAESGWGHWRQGSATRGGRRGLRSMGEAIGDRAPGTTPRRPCRGGRGEAKEDLGAGARVAAWVKLKRGLGSCRGKPQGGAGGPGE